MACIVHIIDDAALGGVTRLLDSLINELSDVDQHHRILAITRLRLPERIEADIIVIHFTLSWAKLPFLMALRWRFRNQRIVLVEHTYTAAFEAARVPVTWLFRQMLRIAYRAVDQVIAVSSGQARWMVQAKLLPAKRIRIIPCVNDLSHFETLAFPIAAGPLRLGAFGRFDRQKGYDILIEAMRYVPHNLAHLYLAGYGADDASLRASAQHSLNISIQGRVDPVDFVSRMDAIVIPSRWEAGAVTCWETRAAGRPLIVSDVDGLPEQVPSDIGIVVPADDPTLLAEAICRLAMTDRTEMMIEARRSSVGAFAAAISAWRDVFSTAERVGRHRVLRRPAEQAAGSC